MSAELFIVFYGLRWEIDGTDNEHVLALEERKDPRQLAGRQHKLDFWWGQTAEDGRFYLLLGRQVGPFGAEGESFFRLTTSEADQIAAETRDRLQAAGFSEEPAWFFQFEPDR